MLSPGKFQKIADIQSLKTINNVSFTNREIDVIACILSGRTSYKEIAALLSLSPRTVETHKKSITQKIHRNIREFFEKSDKYFLLKSHYINLLNAYSFNDTLKKNVSFIQKESVTFDLYFTNDLKQKSLPYDYCYKHLDEYLTLAGLQVTTNSVNITTSSTNIKHNTSNHYALIVLHPDMTADNSGTDTTDLVIKLVNTLLDNQIKIMFLDCTPELLIQTKELGIAEPIFFTTTSFQENFYTTFFDLLSKSDLLTDPQAIKNVQSFLDNYNSNVDLIQQHNVKTAISVESTIELPTNNYGKLFKILSWIRDKRSRIAIIIIATLLLVAIIYNAFVIRHNTTTIRSDLITPVVTSFLERPQIIEQMHRRLKETHGIQTIVLTGIVGMGGAGKTTMARYFAKHNADIPIVWELNAESKTTLINSFRNLAYTLANNTKLKEDLDFIVQTKDANIQEQLLLNFIKTQLKSVSEWMLIYDNMESFSGISHLFPHDSAQWGNGRVIITTRNEHIIGTSYIKPENIVHVDELSDQEKLILFSKILYDRKPDQLSDTDYNKSVEFLKKIPPFPLDVSVAAYSIKNTNVTFEKYINHINEHSDIYDHMQVKVLQETTDYTSTRYGIISSTVDKINKINPHFKPLLTFICFLDSQNIPYKLLENYSDAKVLDDLMYNLRKNGLLSRESYSEFNKNNKAISLHRSTQEIGALFLTNQFTDKEKEYLIGNMVKAVQNFYQSCVESNNTNDIILLIPHLMTLLGNVQNINMPLEVKNKYEVDLYLILGHINHKSTKNLTLAKEYLKIALQKNNNHIKPIALATALKDLCSINMTMNLLEDGLQYCFKSIDACKTAPSSAMIEADNLQIIGNYYRKKNDFIRAKDSFTKALGLVTTVESPAAKEVLAEIYTQLSNLYLMRYLGKKDGAFAEEYGKKALEALGGYQLFYLQSTPLPSYVSCSIARHKWKHAEALIWHHANYDAANANLLDAEYIMKQRCPENMHLKGRILVFLGEILLRKNALSEAEVKLTEGINILNVALGANTTWTHIVERAEINMRLARFNEAYEDCLRVFNVGHIERTSLHDLKYYTAIYHAAIAQYK